MQSWLDSMESAVFRRFEASVFAVSSVRILFSMISIFSFSRRSFSCFSACFWVSAWRAASWEMVVNEWGFDARASKINFFEKFLKFFFRNFFNFF